MLIGDPHSSCSVVGCCWSSLPPPSETNPRLFVTREWVPFDQRQWMNGRCCWVLALVLAYLQAFSILTAYFFFTKPSGRKQYTFLPLCCIQTFVVILVFVVAPPIGQSFLLKLVALYKKLSHLLQMMLTMLLYWIDLRLDLASCPHHHIWALAETAFPIQESYNWTSCTSPVACPSFTSGWSPHVGSSVICTASRTRSAQQRKLG